MELHVGYGVGGFGGEGKNMNYVTMEKQSRGQLGSSVDENHA